MKKSLLGAMTLIGLVAAGCQNFGATAVRQERPNYNEAIHDTSRDQIFINMLRVADNDTTLFMEVTEVDASLQFQGSVNGGATGLGTGVKNPVQSAGSVSGTVQYQESPTIRYQPLAGQPLIAQLSTPVNVDSLVSLYGSDWPLLALLDMASERLAPSMSDSYAALNAIAALDQYNALVVTAEKSELSGQPNKAGAKQLDPANAQSTPSDSRNDSLVLYLEPRHLISGLDETQEQAQARVKALWLRLLRIYDSAQPVHFDLTAAAKATLDIMPIRRIEIRNFGIHIGQREGHLVTEGYDWAPPLQTRSALGILRVGMQRQFGHFVEIVTPERYQQIIALKWNAAAGDFYVLNPALRVTDSTESRAAKQRVIDWLNKGQFPAGLCTVDANADLEDATVQHEERVLGFARRYILIIHQDSPPDAAFVSAHHNGQWYYIAKDDDVSRSNFALIAQFLAIQAIPSQSPALTPTISVGGSH